MPIEPKWDKTFLNKFNHKHTTIYMYYVFIELCSIELHVDNNGAIKATSKSKETSVANL